MRTEPYNIEEAFANAKWKTNAQEEYDALLCNNIWTLVPLPSS